MSVYKCVWAPISGIKEVSTRPSSLGISNLVLNSLTPVTDQPASDLNIFCTTFDIDCLKFKQHPKFFLGIRKFPSPQARLQKPGWSRGWPRRLWSPTKYFHSFGSNYSGWRLLLRDSPVSCHKLTIILLSLASLHLKTGVDQYSTVEVVLKVSNSHPGAISWPCIF